MIGFNCTSQHRASAGRPGAATCSGCHAPAASLGTAYAGLRREAGRKGIAAGANRIGAARYFPAPSALPRVPPFYDHDREIDVEVERVERIRTTQARHNAYGPQIKKITPDTPTDELPWKIYGYGPRHKRHVR